MQYTTHTVRIFLMCTALCSFSRADERDTLAMLNEQKAQLQKMIAEVDADITRTDSLTNIEAKRHTQLKQNMRQALEHQRTEMVELEERLTALNNEVNKLSSQVEQARAGQRRISEQRSYLADQLVQHCRALRDTIQKSLPWDREKRLGRITALLRDIQTGSAGIEEGFSRLLALIDEETQFGDDIVLEERTVQRNDGTSQNARVLRVGNLWMAYVDAAEEQYGVLQRQGDTAFVWNEELSFTEREQLRAVIQVKAAKKVPQIVTLPVSLSLQREREGENEQ